MLYLLEFKHGSIYEDTIISNARSIDFFFTQELSWTNGHFILDSIEEGMIKTLVAYPHIEPPSQELIVIQEYILDKLNINYKSINLIKFISKSDDDTLIYPYKTDSLVIKSLSQDYFFNKILEISIKEKSNYIAAIFYKNYFFDGIINRNSTINYKSNSEYNKKLEYIHKKLTTFYNDKTDTGLPIFIINTRNKNEFQLIRSCIIDEVKKISNLEFQKYIYTPIKEETLIKFIHDIQSSSFSNNILGQVWDISFDLRLYSYNSSRPIFNERLLPILLNLKSLSLIIILNQNYIPLDKEFEFENIIQFL